MDDFIHRTITFEKVVFAEGKALNMNVCRTRTSAGHASITATFHNQRVEFSVDAEYEEHARQFAEMILEAASNPCLLPEVK